MPQAVNRSVDVLIIGGGPAGLAAATSLARQRSTAIVFDSNVYRNRYTSHMHNVPTWDHQDPAQFRAKARADLLARYDSITFEDQTTLTSARRLSKDLFQVTDARGRSWNGRKVILASGIRDIFPDIRGYESCWGKSVFHCLFCHGYEERDSPSAGILADGMLSNPKMALHITKMARRLALSVTIYTNGDSARREDMEEITSSFPDGSVRIEGRKITELHSGEAPARLSVTLEDGSVIEEGFMAHAPDFKLNGPFAEQLGLELAESGDIRTTGNFNETNVAGVYVAGDVTTAPKSAGTSLYQGTLAGVGASFALL